MSKVYFSPMSFDKFSMDQTLPAKFSRMLEQCGLDETVKGKTVAIKIHVGDKLSYSTIPPVFLRILIEFVKKSGGDCFVCDHNIAERRPQDRGYVEHILGCPVLDVCGHLGKYFYTKDVDFRSFKHVDVAGYINDADVLIDFSHVKGHGACGYGGACKNIAMGCVTTRTRNEIHSVEGGIEWDESKCTHCEACLAACNHHANGFDDNGKYDMFYHNCTVCQHCVKVCPSHALTLVGDQYGDFQKAMALCTKTVLDTFDRENVFFINLLTQITVLCDCWGLTTPGLVPDLGIMAGKDIVAVEKACLDAIKVENLIQAGLPQGYELGKEGHLFQRIHGKDPFVQVNALEKNGLGTQEYEIIEVN